jgi:hypothetical protein
LILISQKIHDADLLKLGIPSYDSAMIISTKSGYINEAGLLEYLNKVAIPHWNKKRKILEMEGKNISLLQDSMSTHLNNDVTKLLSKSNINTFEFPPHSTHITQPLDGTIFSRWKHCMKKPNYTSFELTDRSKEKEKSIIYFEGVTGRIKNMNAFRFCGFDLDLSESNIFRFNEKYYFKKKEHLKKYQKK